VREAYSAHSGELYGFAVRSLGDAGLAAEAVQETFLRAWKAGNRVDPEIGSLRTWLFAILRDVVIDLGRAEPLERSLLAWQVEEAMRRIDEHYRQVLVETYYRGRPYAEVATELGVPEGTVKSRINSGLRALKVALEEVTLFSGGRRIGIARFRDMTTARAVVAPAYGGPEKLEVREVEVPAPGAGEVTIEVRAAGVNPVDFKLFSGARGADPDALPLPVGIEVAGVLSAIGPETEIASGGGGVGDEVVAFRVHGGYSSALTVAAADVFAKPATLDFPEAANLLLVGGTAADMLRVVPAEAGTTVVIHGASGAVGASLLQQLAPVGVRAIGTASPGNFDEVRRFGGEPVTYGDGLAGRLRDLAPEGFAAAYDCVGTDEAVDVSLALVGPQRLVTIAAAGRAGEEGFEVVGAARPDSTAFRDSNRANLLDLAARGELVVPVSHTYPLEAAGEALAFLAQGHPGGKLALIP
jgi:NADPH:quinone reductase